MTARDTFLEYILDQLSAVEHIVSRPMFGGVGLYATDVFFGIIYHDILYLKVDDRTRAGYERAGMKPFTPYAPRTTDDLTAWAREAIAAAERSASQKKSSGRPT